MICVYAIFVSILHYVPLPLSQETISQGPVDSTPTKSTKPLRKVKRSKSSPQYPGGEVPGEHEVLKRAKFSALCDVDRVKRVKTKSERTVKVSSCKVYASRK